MLKSQYKSIIFMLIFTFFIIGIIINCIILVIEDWLGINKYEVERKLFIPHQYISLFNYIVLRVNDISVNKKNCPILATIAIR